MLKFEFNFMHCHRKKCDPLLNLSPFISIAMKLHKLHYFFRPPQSGEGACQFWSISRPLVIKP